MGRHTHTNRETHRDRENERERWGDTHTGRKEMFYLMTHSTHFIYGYMASDHSDSERGNPLPPHRLSFRLAARVILYASSHRQDNTYHGLCYTSCGALAGTRNN